MSQQERKRSEAEALAEAEARATSAADGLDAAPGFAGPGYGGFGGSAGYNGAGVGGIAGGYTGGSADFSWTPPPETRHDDRIHDDVIDRLSLSDEVDASAIQVEVEAGGVTLTGHVENRHMKQAAGDIAEAVPGVSSVHNRLHVEHGLIDELKERLIP